ncbi:hypothetical protein LEP1GSC195_0631 [Leptospira wolbachii serovar Codice str. CDC]|uniref:Uncharacterized protein n=1 Tax=Leptospira wolbachii serovar Codice str. CDC TaxID=1218599 RepID=R9A8G3_9LEPT|nr:hypothetical protein LEP1GSC195_0631 [Leptospira wolbachii serovar Codice str. CDC]
MLSFFYFVTEWMDQWDYRNWMSAQNPKEICKELIDRIFICVKFYEKS